MADDASISKPRRFAEIRSRAWRTVLLVATNPFVKILYGIVYALAIWPLGKLVRVDMSGICPAHLWMRLHDRASGFQVHSDRWNRRKLSAADVEVEDVEKRCRWLEDNVQSDEAILKEHASLIDQVALSLAENAEWIHLEGLDERRAACASALDSLGREVRMRAISLAVETMRRKMDGLRLYRNQILAAIQLADNNFIELRNGEGKTFVAVPVMAWAAIRVQGLRKFCEQKKVDAPFTTSFLFTANNYLVRRDFARLKHVYESMGISVAYIDSRHAAYGERRDAYSADIVLMEGTEFGFDYLRNSARSFGKKPIQQSPYCVLVDEADQLLLDEARTPLVLSGESSVVDSMFVEEAWVRQVDLWVRDIFLDNRLFDKAQGGEYSLTTAGQFFIRSVLEEKGIDTWSAFSAYCLDTFGVTPLCIMAQLLLHVPEFASQLPIAVADALRGLLDHFGRPLRMDKRSGKLRLTKDAAVAILGKLPRSIPTLSELTELLRWVWTEGRQHRKFFRGATKRQVLALLGKLLTSPYLLSEWVECMLNEIRDGASEIHFPADFIEGIGILSREIMDQKLPQEEQPVAQWLCVSGLPGVAGVLAPSLENIASQPGKGARAGLALVIRAFMVVVEMPPLPFSRSRRIQQLMDNFALVGALMHNFLFFPESGNLTAAGRRVALLLEEHCHLRNLDENHGAGGIVDLIEKALYVYFGYEEGREYVIDRGTQSIVLVNQISGRLEPSKSFGRSLHPFVQAKHGLHVQEPIPTKRTITMPNLCRPVPRLIGMSGTIVAEERELRRLYAPGATQSKVVVIPPKVEPRIERKQPILAITKAAKWRAIAEEVVSHRQKSKQPVLIITASVQDSEELARKLRDITKTTVEFHVLNARYEEMEEEIVQQAGQLEAITIATQMAARGTDIFVSQESVEQGGLYVIIAELHEIGRLDHQAEGRAARHGDPGASRYFCSVDDSIMRMLPEGAKTVWRNVLSWSTDNEESQASEVPTIVQRELIRVREEYAFRQQKNRELISTVDSFVDYFRRDADLIREHFVDGELPIVIEGVAEMARIHLDDMLQSESFASLGKLACRIAEDIVSDNISGQEIARRYEGQVRFKIPIPSFDRVTEMYREQLTPSLTEPGENRSFSLSRLIMDRLVQAARDNDLDELSESWPRLCHEFNLAEGFDFQKWVALTRCLNQSLCLGFTRRDVAYAASLISDVNRTRRFGPHGVDEWVRKALVEAIAHKSVISSAAQGIASASKPVIVGGVNLTGYDYFSALAQVREMATRILGRGEESRRAFCIEWLTIFDEQWERVLDDVRLCENRIFREGWDDASWSEILSETQNKMNRMFSELASQTLALLDRMRQETLCNDRRDSSKRVLDVGSLGPIWFLPKGDSDPSMEVLHPVEYEAFRRGLEESKAIDDPQDLVEEASPSVHDSLSELLQVLARRGWNPRIKSPGVCSVLFREFCQGDTDQLLALAESAYVGNDLLKASALLDLVDDPRHSARLRTLIFEKSGCRKNELAHLRMLQRSSQMEVRLRLRMTHLLCRGSAEDRQEAAVLLSQAVPDVPETARLDDYGPVEALITALAQLCMIGEYDSAVALFANKQRVLPASFLNVHLVYYFAANALARASQKAKDSFEQEIQGDWRSWLVDKFMHIYHEAQEAPMGDGFGERPVYQTLTRMAISAGRADLVACMIRRIVQRVHVHGRWAYLAYIFDDSGLDFEARLFLCRHHIVTEEFEEALEEASWLEDHGGGDDVRACRIYASMGLARCLQDHLYARQIVDRALAEGVDLLNSVNSESGPTVVRQLLLEAYCRKQDFAAAIELVDRFGDIGGPWPAIARTAHALTQVRLPSEISAILGTLAEDTEGRVEAFHLVAGWFEGRRRENGSEWKTDAVFEGVTCLDEAFASALEEEHSYKAMWGSGIAAKLRGEWCLENGDRAEGLSDLKRAAYLWDRALSLTHDSSRPYKSRLGRDERLNREIIEEDLRRCMRAIKVIESGAKT